MAALYFGLKHLKSKVRSEKEEKSTLFIKCLLGASVPRVEPDFCTPPPPPPKKKKAREQRGCQKSGPGRDHHCVDFNHITAGSVQWFTESSYCLVHFFVCLCALKTYLYLCLKLRVCMCVCV